MIDLTQSLTNPQRDCVTHVDGPLLVSAGAGSGKTFMLTRRIAYALAHPEQSGVHEIDQDVLAITFTELAAGEIKARVRSTLRSIGMVDQALKVDASWISTIHGMCSRILHEHALDLGLDPAFTILDDTDRDRLVLESINEALALAGKRPTGESPDEDASEDDAEDGGDSATAAGGRGRASRTRVSAASRSGGELDEDDAADIIADDYRALFEEFESGRGASKVQAFLQQLIDASANVRGGLDALVLGPDAQSPRDIARCAHEALADIRGAVHANLISATGKQTSKYATKALDAINDPVTGIAAFERLANSDATTYADVAGALDEFNPAFGAAPKDVKAENLSFRLEYAHICLECMLGLARTPRDQLVALARQALAIFSRKKAHLCKLDQNDLLNLTLDALENNPAIAAQYCGKFKLVMVDEFQDTSALQIAIISKLDGENDSCLCTVGDTQQSIYRFRGADVGTYHEHKRHMREEAGALYCELGKNFRSDGDIIEFVNKLFSQDQVFGSGEQSEFIKLGYVEDRASDYPPEQPRIDVTMVANAFRAGNSLQRHRVLAQAVCDRFIALHEEGVAGHEWRDMVILLGAMRNAGLYADTLRAHGIPCIIAGGSIFSSAPESQAICDLACAIANPKDNARLAAVLESDMFGLTADELLRIATDESLRRRSSLWSGLYKLADDPSPRVRLASATMRNAVRAAGSKRPSEVLTAAVLESGWLDRLQEQGPEGMAQAANVLKAIRLAKTQEEDPHAPRAMAGVAQRLATKFEQGMKEAPGALNATGQNAVRIMTIHASKGLEFPIVALGDFYKSRGSSGNLALETSGDAIYLSLTPAGSVNKNTGTFKKLAGYAKEYDKHLKAASKEEGFVAPDSQIEDAGSAAEFRRSIATHANEEELAEVRRKFYVGATRPREVLIIAAEGQSYSDPAKYDGKFYSSDVLEDLRLILTGPQGDFPDNPDGVEFGGHARAACARLQLSKDEDGNTLVGNLTLDEYLGLVEAVGEGEADEGKAEGPDTTGPWEGGSAWTGVPEPIDIDSLMPLALPCNPLRANTFSYSSIARHEDEADEALAEADGEQALDGSPMQGGVDPDEIASSAEERLTDLDESVSRRVAADPTAFGSAFHTAAQWMAERIRTERGEAHACTGEDIATWEDAPVPVACASDRTSLIPTPERLAQIARTWELNELALPRLRQALELWASSDVAAQAYARTDLQPEAPLYVTLQGPQGEPLHMEGSIDLLCTDAGIPREQQRALVIDYKTGGSVSETPEQLEAKHLLQAKCYAYAVLLQGYAGVDLRFVRVEVEDRAASTSGAVGGANPQPQVVRYAFEQGQLEELAGAIRDAVRAARG